MDSDQILTYTSKVDALVDRIDALLDHQTSGRNEIVVTHTQGGNGGFLTGIAVSSCVATVFLMLAFIIIENRSYAHMDARLDQIKAWSDVNAREIARLQALQQKEKP